MREILETPPDWERIQATWKPPAELQSAPPRRVLPKSGKVGPGARAFEGCIGCWMVFMFLVGLLMVWWGGLALLMVPFGTQSEGTITGRTFSSRTGRFGRSDNLFLKFEFRRGARIYAGEWPVDEKTYYALPDGARANVRFFPFAPGVRPQLVRGKTSWLHILGLGPLGFLMLGVSGLILAGFWAPKRGKNLVRKGIAAPGVVVARVGENDGRGEHQIRSIVVAFGSEEKSFKIAPNQAADWPLGRVVTLVLLPRKPQTARPYEWCDFRGASQLVSTDR